MKRLALLVVVMIIALCLLLYSCGKGKNKTPEPPDDSAEPTGQVDELPNELPEFLPEEPGLPMLVGYVLKEGVNVRASASTEGSAVGKVSRGDMLKILKSGTVTGSNGGTWYEVLYNGNNAYIHSDFLEAKEMSEDEVISIGSVVNVDSVLNIRAEPSPQSQRVGRANKGDKFVILDNGVGDGSWTQIEFSDGNDGVAYIKSEFLNVVQQKVVNMLRQ